MLFGVIETRAEIRARAKQIHELLSALEDAPLAIEQRQGNIDTLRYFIQRSNAGKLDPNDRDAMVRFGIETGDILTARDCAQMRRNKKIWKKGTPGYLGQPKGWTYCTKLHPKEIAYMEAAASEEQADIDAIQVNVPIIREQLDALCAIGALHPKDAERLNLTRDGQRRNKPTNDEIEKRINP